MVEYTPAFIQESAARANANMIAYFKRETPRLLAAHHEELPDLSACFQMVKDPEAYINGGFMNRIGGLYTPEEREFILDVCARFERVKLGFAYFSLLGSNQRPFEAMRLANSQLRTGWQKTGVPLGFNQSLADHLVGIQQLAFLLFFDDPDIEQIERICAYHDAGEPVIGDFTPHCPISREDKSRIELLGLRLITSAKSRGINFLAEWIHEAVTIYDGNDPAYNALRSKVKDCDLLEMCGEALFLMANCPQHEAVALNEKLQEFWDYVGSRLTNDRAKNFFESLSTTRYRTNLAKKDFKDIIRHAHQFMLTNDPDGAKAHLRFKEAAATRMKKEELASDTSLQFD
jgi:5'-deoxynucleotidase YfbR-like HD superfamily hydrolase